MRNQTGKSGGDVVLVLLVDDEEHQRELTELSLVGVDPTLVITSTQTPSQALKLLSERPFDCLVSDYQMPGMNGVELCAEVRKTSTWTRFRASSGGWPVDSMSWMSGSVSTTMCSTR